jgi:hypothetical protein
MHFYLATQSGSLNTKYRCNGEVAGESGMNIAAYLGCSALHMHAHLSDK